MLSIASSRLPGSRAFHLLLAGLAVSSIGTWLSNVALLALVFERTGSPTWVALTTVARVLPIVVLGPLGGVLADRYDRRRLILASDLAQGALTFALVGVAASGLPVLLVPILAAAATAAASVHPPSVAASTARLVDDEDLPRANALRAGIGQAAIVVGPALGAGVLALSSPSVAILVNALSFVASAMTTLAIRPGDAFVPAARGGGEAPSVLDDVREGVAALRGAPVAVRFIAADVVCSAVYGVMTVTLVLVGHAVGAGAGGYGLLLGAFGVGGLGGAAIAAKLGPAASWRRSLGFALALVGLPVVALGLVHTLWIALALAVVGGAGSIVAEVLSETALPRMLDDEVLARAYGLALPVSLAGIVAGSLVAGPLVALLGLTGAMVATGLGVLAIAAALVQRPLSTMPARPVVAAS